MACSEEVSPDFSKPVKKKLVSLAAIFQHFVSDLAHRENIVISRNTGASQWWQALGIFGLGPSVGN